MAIADLDAYRELLENYQQLYTFTCSPANAANAGEYWDSWQLAGGATPSTAVVPARTDAGSLRHQNGGATALRILQVSYALGNLVSNGYSPSLWVCDRLSHQGGLSGTVTTEQTTNLPTAALTRYTDGVGVMCGLSIYTNIGTTQQDVSVRYTAGGVGSKNSPAISMVQPTGPPAVRVAPIIHLIPCASGADRGFQSVEGVTLTGSTGTAGNFGVTLFKPLAMVAGKDLGDPNRLHDFLFEPGLVGGLAEVLDDACLFFLFGVSESSMNQWGTIHLGVE